MRIRKTDLGLWQVLSPEGEIISEHRTNAEAWRAADRLEGEPVNKREDTADWIWRKNLDHSGAA